MLSSERQAATAISSRKNESDRTLPGWVSFRNARSRSTRQSYRATASARKRCRDKPAAFRPSAPFRRSPPSWLDEPRMRQGHILQEDAVLAQNEPLLLRELVILASQGVCRQPCAVGFVRGEAIDIVDAVSDRARTLVRREIADQVGAASWDGLASGLGILIELSSPVEIQLIADEAGDHRVLLSSRFKEHYTAHLPDASSRIEVCRSP
jgi:hypothetical protein